MHGHYREITNSIRMTEGEINEIIDDKDVHTNVDKMLQLPFEK